MSIIRSGATRRSAAALSVAALSAVGEDEITGLALGPDDHTCYVAGTNNAATAGLQITQH
ncbi:hypothetical protein ACIG5E_29560 [Kitasatospora sp. NPDC053057]|uniref:hypothetical protein n=1 Tax=Kitasatospora sp. NPDC053057 TaxID=3364062 RepID=UPI0037CC736F